MIEVIFIFYLLLIICVGILSNKFVSSQLDFLLAGRRLGPWVTAFSERASGESAWLLLGLPGAAIAIGYGEIWAVIGITIGIISSWFLIAERLRDETEKFDSLTIPDFLEKKFNDSSGFIRIISALMLGLNKEKSIQYCFFMVIPVIILSIFYELLFSSGFDAINLLGGLGLFLSSFIFGYLSLYFLVAFLKKFDFWWFGLYCIIVSIIT